MTTQKASSIFRDFVTEGVPSSGINEPYKADVRQWGTEVEDQLETLATSLNIANAHWGAPVAVATTSNIASLSGEQTIDGVLTSASDILVKNQTTASQNGVYTTGAGAWVRRPDADTQADLVALAVFVRGGTVNAGRQYICTNTGTLTIGTTAIAFQLISDQSALNATLVGKVDKTYLDTIQFSTSSDITVSVPSASGVFSAGDVLQQSFEDANGNAVAGIKPDGTFVVEKQLIGFSTSGGITSSGSDANYDVAFYDNSNNVIWGIKDNEVVSPPTLLDADTRNKLFTASWFNKDIKGVQLPTADYNTIVLYGQSLAMGHEGWPALTTSKAQQFGNLMWGGDVRPNTLDGASWTSQSPTGFQPLVAKCTDNTTGAILSDVAVAALSPGDGARGETSVVGMANTISWLLSRKYLATQKPFVAICPAVSGKTIEQLSKVNTQDATNRYTRFTQAISQIQSAAAGASKTHAVTAIVWMQGEWDYDTTNGSTKATKALYKAMLAQLRTDMIADIKVTTGQTEDPIFILYQTGASYTRDVDSASVPGLHIGMAHLEFALENPNKVILAGPIYPATDKNGHLDSNGYRQFGTNLAKAYVGAVIEGKRFRPLSPIKIEKLTPFKVRVHFSVPKPPLQFSSAYVVNTATDYTAKGFRVTDAGGDVPIVSVGIVADTIVEINLLRQLSTSPYVWYASQTVSAGNGNLCDSDDVISKELYEYTAGTGQYASANIAALVNKPYDQRNWATAFYLPVGYTEV